MMLTHNAIIEALKEGRIVIDPEIDSDSIREASVDLRLGDTFRVFRQAMGAVDIMEDTDYKALTSEVKTSTLLVSPGQTVLGVTVEKITLPNDLAAWIEGRSRFARLGLLIHISAGLIQPGVSNHQVLEITNLSPNVLALHAGERICQLVFQECKGTALYQGKFRTQAKP